MLWLISPRQPVELGPEDHIDTRPGQPLMSCGREKWVGLTDFKDPYATRTTTVAEVGEPGNEFAYSGRHRIEEIRAICSQHEPGAILRWRGGIIVETGPTLSPNGNTVLKLARMTNPQTLADYQLHVPLSEIGSVFDLTIREIKRAHDLPIEDAEFDDLSAMRERGVAGLVDDGKAAPSDESVSALDGDGTLRRSASWRLQDDQP